MNAILKFRHDDLARTAIRPANIIRAPQFTPGKSHRESIAVIGLGYVGLPLAVHLAESFANVQGLDISTRRIAELHNGIDATNEIQTNDLLSCGLEVSDQTVDIADASFYIVTVPTPITANKQPDLSPLDSACRTVGPHLKKGDIVVFESTVYPGVTEDHCGPLLEQISGLKAGKDFGLGYSPERINPGDKVNTVNNVVKVISGDCDATIDRMYAVYSSVIDAGLHVCPSIKVAEASKVIENTQRDVNIALMNEVSVICDRIGIDSADVIEAASTKWNFVPFTPGLVGGHCIGVDPYYLASLAEKVGHNPQVIMAGRRQNDSMVAHIKDAVLRLLIEHGGSLKDKRIGVFGITFKEDVPDVRNSKTIELIKELKSYGLDIMIHDPHCSNDIAKSEGVELSDPDDMKDLDLMLLAVPHQKFREDKEFLSRIGNKGILVDLRGAYRKNPEIEKMTYWSL